MKRPDFQLTKLRSLALPEESVRGIVTEQNGVYKIEFQSQVHEPETTRTKFIDRAPVGRPLEICLARQDEI